MRHMNSMHSVGAVVAAIVMMGFSGSASAQGITGTPHDFSGSGWTGPDNEICVACHTPHNADTTIVEAPLWNHETTTATFTPYSSPTLDASVGQPGGISKLCLSCHDGTVALDSFGGVTGTTFMATSAAGYVGIDLSNDHPISFAYVDGLDAGLHDPTTTDANLPGGTGTITTDMLFATNLECASCHDPHDSVGVTAMLVKPNTGSDLCLTCHNK